MDSPNETSLLIEILSAWDSYSDKGLSQCQKVIASQRLENAMHALRNIVGG